MIVDKVTIPFQVYYWNKEAKKFLIDTPFDCYEVSYKETDDTKEPRCEELRETLGKCFDNYPRNFLMTFEPEYRNDGTVCGVKKVLEVWDMPIDLHWFSPETKEDEDDD